MNPRSFILSLLSIVLLTGCASFTGAELGRIRERGVSPGVVAKFRDGQVLSPQDVIELTRRGVPDRLILRQIEDAGVNYVLGKNDIKRLRAAGVSAAVLDALIDASDDFAHEHAGRRYDPAFGVYADYPYDYYYGPGSYYPYGSVGLGFYAPFPHHWSRWH
jgi:hypothetical protein